MTKEEKLILLQRLTNDFISYNWSDGKALNHYYLVRRKYKKVLASCPEKC